MLLEHAWEYALQSTCSSVYDTEHKLKKKKQRRAGNEAREAHSGVTVAWLEAPLLWNANIEVVQVERSWYIFSCEQRLG